MKVKPKYRGGALSMQGDIQSYFDYMDFSSFKRNYNENKFLEQNPKYKGLFERIQQVQA